MAHLLRMPSKSLLLAMLVAAAVFLAAGASVGQHGLSYAADSGDGTPANSTPQTVDGNGKTIKCDQVPEAKGGVLLGKIIPCLTYTVEKSAVRFSKAMIDWLRPLFYAFLTFVITMFGLKVLQNEGQIQSHAFVLLIKIGFVLTVLQLIPGTNGNGGLIRASYAIINESQAVVMRALSAPDSSYKCPIDKFKDGNTPLIWAQMDCLLGQLYGYTTGGTDASGVKRPNMVLASSMVGLLGGFFFGGSFGVALFFLCIGVLWGMFSLVMRITLAFLNSYMFLALYMILAPLLLPLIFLRVTSQIYEKWLSGIIAAMLMPLVISSYVVVAMQLYDKLLFADDSLMKNIFENEWVKQGQESSRELCNKEITADPNYRALTTAQDAKSLYNNALLGPAKSFLTPMFGAANNICGAYKAPVFNLKAATPEYETAKKGFEKLFRDAIKLFVLAFLIDQGFKTLTAAVRPMLGSSSVVASLDTKTEAELRLDSGMARAKQNFQGNLASKSGADFITSTPKAFTDASKGFFEGIRK